MNNTINNNETELRYVIMVHGMPCGPQYPSPEAANAAMLLISEAHQSIAEIVPVTYNGNRLLLG